MKDKLLAIAEQYQMRSFESRIKEILALDSVKIAFLGAYSAGKTSLINAMLGLKLPVAEQATTKSICLIEPTEEISSNEYFQDIGLNRENISFLQFQSLLNGDKEGIAGVRVKSSEHLPLGSVFIDTPGFDNTGSSEGDLTTAYLQFIDAAVICIDVRDGTIKNHILQYLLRPELTPIREKMIFVLTRAKLERGEHAYDSVIKEVAKQAENRLQISNASSKITVIDSLKSDAPNKVLDLLKKNIYAKRESAIQNRIMLCLKSIAQEMFQLLKFKRDNLSCDTVEIDKKIQNVRNSISMFEDKLYEHRNDLEKLNKSLCDSIKQIMKSYVSTISSMEGEQLQSEINRMQESINSTSQIIVNNYIKNCTLTQTVTNECMNDLVSRFKSVDEIKNTAVTVSTAAIFAYVFPAASVTGNAAEAVGGGTIQVASKNVGEKVANIPILRKIPMLGNVKNKGKNDNKTVAKDEDAKKAESFLKKALAETLKTFDKVNPIEQVGTFFANKIKASSFENIIHEKAQSISKMIVSSVQYSFDSEIIQPLTQQLNEQMNILEQLKEQKENNSQNYQKQSIELEKNIKELAEMI